MELQHEEPVQTSVRTQLIIISLLYLVNLPLKAELPFNQGDRFSYDLYWSFIEVGKADLYFANDRLEEDGENLVHATFTVQTKGIADRLFKVRDKIESWIEPETGRPLLYKKKQREGKTKRDIEVHFDWEEMTATYTKNGKTYEPISISEDTLDPLSLILSIAGSKFVEGQVHSLATTDGKKHLYIDLYRKNNEKIKTSAGRFTAQHLEVATKELQGVFEKSPDASIELWLTTDIPSIPLKMRSEVTVGSFYGELSEANYKGRKITAK